MDDENFTFMLKIIVPMICMYCPIFEVSASYHGPMEVCALHTSWYNHSSFTYLYCTMFIVLPIDKEYLTSHTQDTNYRKFDMVLDDETPRSESIDMVTGEEQRHSPTGPEIMTSTDQSRKDVRGLRIVVTKGRVYALLQLYWQLAHGMCVAWAWAK